MSRNHLQSKTSDVNLFKKTSGSNEEQKIAKNSKLFQALQELNRSQEKISLPKLKVVNVQLIKNNKG